MGKKGKFHLVKFLICSKKNRDIKGQKGTISFSQFHLFRRNETEREQETVSGRPNLNSIIFDSSR